MSPKEKAVAIIRRLRDEGFEAYLAGGCVRDELLGKAPQDYDIATDARPEAVQKIFPRTAAVGTQFGVVLVMIDAEPFEVATFRHDGPYLDGRRPSHVRFASLREDILRRDFTINGMVCDPLNDRVIDLVGGREDLSRRLIRAIGDPAARFQEDRLRMVRAIRFAAGLGFEIEDETFSAIRQQAPSITQISWERIGEEITRILTEGEPKRGFELLDSAQLLQFLIPEIESLKGVEQSHNFHPEGDVFTHTLLTLSHLARPTETLAYGCLLHDIAKPVCIKKEADQITFYGHTEKGAEMAEDILARLKRSRAVRERVAYLVKNHLRHIQAPKMRVSTLKRFLGEEGIEELLELARIDALSSNGDLQYYDFCRQKKTEFKHVEIHPEPLLRGKDLAAMGFTPGPLFGDILNGLEEAQLEGQVSTRNEAVEWVRKQYGH